MGRQFVVTALLVMVVGYTTMVLVHVQILILVGHALDFVVIVPSKEHVQVIVPTLWFVAHVVVIVLE